MKMHLFSSRHQFNTTNTSSNKSITITNNNNNNVDDDDVIFSNNSDNKNKFTSDHAVIPKETTGGNIESDIVLVTYTFNGTSSNSSTSTLTSIPTTTSTIQGSISGSTLPMRLKITSDNQLILLRKESEVDCVDEKDDGGNHGILSINNSDSNNVSPIKGHQHLPGTENLRARSIDEYRTVKLVREKSVGFGLSIKGGCEHGLPILISGLTKEGPADRSRQLFIGDAIVRIDSTILSLTTTTHEEAIRLLKQAGVEVNLTVKHFKMVSPFLTKCWRKRQTLDNEAGNLMVSTTTTNSSTNSNNNGTNKQEKGKQLAKSQCNVTNGSQSSPSSFGKLQTSNGNSDNNNNYGKEKGKVKKEKIVNVNHQEDKETINEKWIPLISIDLGNCFITKYIHDSDKIRPQSFEIRWLRNNLPGQSYRSNSCPSTSSSSSSSSSTSGTSSSYSSTTSLSTPKSTDSGVGVGIKFTNNNNNNGINNSTIKPMGHFKEPLPIVGQGGIDGRTIKTYSSAIVICNNQQIYSQWFNMIERSVKTVTNNQMVTLNQHLPGNEKIFFMGWINQGLPSTSSEPHRPCYHWYTRYLVIKGGDALIYIKPPQGLLPTSNDNSSSSTTTTTDTSKTTQTTTTETTTTTTSSSSHPTTIRWSEGHPYLFKAHQSVLRCLKPSEYVDERENCFLLLSCDTNYSSTTKATKSPLKTKTSSLSTPKQPPPPPPRTTTDHHPDDDEKSNLTNNPIQTANESTNVCYFSVETPSELALIRNNWNRATYQSVTQLGSKSFPVTCSGKLGSLILDYRYGFTFSAATTTTGHHPAERNNNTNHGSKQDNWSFKFSQLKTSSDDGRSTLWLSFRVPMLSSSSPTTSSSSTSSRYEINKERLRRLPVNPSNHPNPHHGRSSETLTHSSTSSITIASDNPNQPASSSSSSSSSSGSLLSSTLNHHQQQSESINQLTIQTREIKTNQLQHLLYCIHAFLTAKVIAVDQSFLC